MDWIPNQALLEYLSYCIQVIGVPVGVTVFVYGKYREIKDRENGTYATLGDAYKAYLATCLEHPDLPVFDGSSREMAKLTEDQSKRTQIIYCILVSMLEQAYLLYREARSRTRKHQWAGWEVYLDEWLGNPNFQQLWPQIQSQFDAQFVAYVQSRSACALAELSRHPRSA